MYIQDYEGRLPTNIHIDKRHIRLFFIGFPYQFDIIGNIQKGENFRTSIFLEQNRRTLYKNRTLYFSLSNFGFYNLLGYLRSGTIKGQSNDGLNS